MSQAAAPPAGSPAEHSGGKRWLILVVGLIAMTAGCTFQYGMSYYLESQLSPRTTRLVTAQQRERWRHLGTRA
jgi:hypothetical protein